VTEPTADELYRLLVEQLEEYAVIILDPARRVVTWNRGAERMLGYPSAETVGRQLDALFTPVDRQGEAARAEAGQARADGWAANHRWHVRKDGSRFWANEVVFRLEDAQGGVRGVAKVLRDETALKAAEDERQAVDEALRASELRFRRLIEANVMGAGIRNDAGVWVDANDALLRLLGHTRDDLRAGRIRWDAMTPPEYQPRDEQAAAEAMETGACTPYEKEFFRPDGRRVPALVGFAPVTGVDGHFVCFVLDLTDQKRVERELREADRRKDEFLAMLAHELRNPLAPIRTALQVLKREDAPPPVHARARETMERQVAHLVRLVDDLLDVSRIMQGKVELRPEPTDLQTVVTRAVEASQPLLDAQGHTLTLDLPAAPIRLHADPVRLSQVVSNLLNNAAKYTEPGGAIRLTAEREDDQVRLAVRDTGIGIPAERLPHVFDLFMQVDSTLARTQGGLGIGLTLVKRLAEMHGGSVRADSVGPGRGSTFTVRLPVVTGSETDTPPPPAGAAAGRPLRVLVVDDNVDAADTLSMLLGLLGHDVRTAYTAADGLRAIDGHDLVLLDIGLPDRSGYEVAREIRRLPNGNRPVLTAVTGYGHEEDRAAAKAAGFDLHLIKPVDPERLMRLLAEVARGERSAVHE
jgi:PAS domain S-box-containing protein